LAQVVRHITVVPCVFPVILMAPKRDTQSAPKSKAAAAKPKAKTKAEAKATAGRAAAKAKVVAKAEAKARGAPKGAAKAAAKGAAREPTPKARATPDAGQGDAKRPKKSASGEQLEKAKAAATSGKTNNSLKVVDNKVPGRGTYTVYEDYAIKLMQTHIDGNNNKYYVIQVLQGAGAFWTWNRWGRVGEDGQNKLSRFADPNGAIRDFEKKFRDKTSNAWAALASFTPKSGKYTIVETEETEAGGQDAPMGKLTEAQIGKGQMVLDKLGKELAASAASHTLETLSSEFYTLIPHNFGRQRPVAIKTDEMLQSKIELLKFYLRMGFEAVEEEGLGPISGVLDLPCPATLEAACPGLCSKNDLKTSSEKGEALAKKQAGSPVAKMSGHLYGAIMLYTSNAIYRELNECLRNENRVKIKKFFKYLRLFFESMSFLPKQKKTLWRGLSVDLFDNPQYDVGKSVVWWGVSSTTADINVAKNFAKGCGGKCTILTIESETASDISQITFYSNEKESLLAPGTELMVKSKKRNGNVTEILLQEIGRVIQ